MSMKRKKKHFVFLKKKLVAEMLNMANFNIPNSLPEEDLKKIRQELGQGCQTHFL